MRVIGILAITWAPHSGEPWFREVIGILKLFLSLFFAHRCTLHQHSAAPCTSTLRLARCTLHLRPCAPACAVGKVLALPGPGGWHVLQINVNGASREGQSRPENWGELLDLLERGDGLSRQIVTAVRFGGVAVPTFREPSELARELQDVDRIDVETATIDELLHESAQTAYD